MAGETRTTAGDLTAAELAALGVPATPAPVAGTGPAARGAAGPGAPGAPASPPTPMSRERAAAFGQILDLLARAPHEFDFFQVMRRLEGLYTGGSERPRFGAALRPADEPIRLGQEPSLAFAPAELAGVQAGREGPARLLVHFFGLFGPNGPLPLHLTEYARDRTRNADDATMTRFMDVFHHRMLMLFYRSWASAQPTVSHDRPSSDRFIAFVGSMIGVGFPSLMARDKLPDAAKLFYAGRLGAQTRNADGLAAVIGDFFQMPARIEEFVGDWLELPIEHRWRLGSRTQPRLLGISTTAGGHTWSRQHKFRVTMGPLDRAQFQRMLPGGPSLPKLNALVRNYVGDELRWDLRLILEQRVDHPWQVGASRLGWTTWAGRPALSGRGNQREDLILDPQGEALRAAV
jgi:type VI secretion system protein ImpH